MAERDLVRRTKIGVTLIEVMVALVVFSFLIGLSSRFVVSAVDRPYVLNRVEPWLTFIEQTYQSMARLSDDSTLLLPGRHTDPFPGLTQPPDLTAWWLDWEDTNLDEVMAARFTATTIQGRTIEWYLYHSRSR
jgi:prepilin-type N-terminal cleavage/methylation domain-containing protein